MGAWILLKMVLSFVVLLSFFSTIFLINERRDFFSESNRANTLIKYGIDDLSIFTGDAGFKVVTIHNLNDMYSNFTGNWIYLYWRYNKITVNDSKFIHQNSYPLQWYYCKQYYLTKIVDCIRIY